MNSKYSYCVIRLRLGFISGEPRWATGTIVRDKVGRVFLVTNRHVVSGENVFPRQQRQAAPITISGEVRLHSPIENKPFSISLADTSGKWLELLNVGYDADVFRRAYKHIDVTAIDLSECVATDQIARVVAVDLDDLYPEQHSEADELLRGLCVTDSCFVAGFPMSEGMTPNASLPVFKSGTVATEPRTEQLHYFLLDSPSREGMSGSAVIHRTNSAISNVGLETQRYMQFVGIYSGSFLPETSQRATQQRDFGLGIVWSLSKAIRPLLASVRS